MDKFLPYDDELGLLIQARASELYYRMRRINADTLGMPPHCLEYFKSSHAGRLFFSIETSAHLLYRSIKMTGKDPAEMVMMDYGAGVGALYLLAKMTGFKKVIYNDHLEDWQKSARLVAEAAGIEIDHYLVGDIEESLADLERLGLTCDLITSRNVIEHIYRLDLFYNAIHRKQPGALIYSSTTANKYNPASVVKHRLWHRKWEKVYKGKRLVVIQWQAPGLSAAKANALAASTRGLAGEDLKEAIEEYRRSGKMQDPSVYGSNTCDPSNGVWAEHLLSEREYRNLINKQFYRLSVEAGFWDTHYASAYKNKLCRLLNRKICRGGKAALRLAPFIYVIASPRENVIHG